MRRVTCKHAASRVRSPLAALATGSEDLKGEGRASIASTKPVFAVLTAFARLGAKRRARSSSFSRSGARPAQCGLASRRNAGGAFGARFQWALARPFTQPSAATPSVETPPMLVEACHNVFPHQLTKGGESLGIRKRDGPVDFGYRFLIMRRQKRLLGFG